MRRLVGVIICGLFAACGAREPVPAVPATEAGPPPLPEASAPVERADAGSDGEASTPPPLKLTAVPAPATSGAPHVEILFPFAEQRVRIPKAAKYGVRLRVEGVKLAATGPGVEASLDGARPRRVLALDGTKLSALTPEGDAPKPGAHWLFVAAVDASGAIARGNGGSRAPYAAVRFWVGDRPSPPPPVQPRVVLFRPQGTYNGEAAADAVVVDFLALPGRTGIESGSVRVRLTGAGASAEARLESWQLLRAENLPSGDFVVQVELLDAKGAPVPGEGARASRTITVNREVDVGGGK